jgi:hypothetical protein
MKMSFPVSDHDELRRLQALVANVPKQRRAELDRMLSNIPEHESPFQILHTDDMERRLQLITQLEAKWMAAFTSLTQRPMSQCKPFNDLQVAALVQLGVSGLEQVVHYEAGLFGLAMFEGCMQGLQSLPSLAKLCKSNIRLSWYQVTDHDFEDTPISSGLTQLSASASVDTWSSDPTPSHTQGQVERSQPEKAKRLALDGHRCIIAKTVAPDVCHIVPFSINAKETARAWAWTLLKNVEGLLAFTGRQYPLDDLRTMFASSVGVSDQKWNMVSMNRTLHDWWGRAYFALKYLGTTSVRSKDTNPADIITLKLQFLWMPMRKLNRQEGKPAQRFPKSAQGFFQAFNGTYGMPNEGSAIGRPATGWLIESGDIFYVTIQNKYVDRMVCALDVQLALILMIAMAGGAECLDDIPRDPEFLNEHGQFPGLEYDWERAFRMNEEEFDWDPDAEEADVTGEPSETHDLPDCGSKEEG